MVTLATSVNGPENPFTLLCRELWAQALLENQKAPQAEAESRVTLAAYDKVLGYDNPGTPHACHTLALALKAQEKTGEARELARRAVDTARAVLGESHPSTVMYAKTFKELSLL